MRPLFIFLMLFSTFNLAFAQVKTEVEDAQLIMKGIASYYHDKFHGRMMANGENYSRDSLTAASNVFPLNKWVKVTNTRNGKSVIVKITDKMARGNKRIIDLSRKAAEELEMIYRGLVSVKVELLTDNQ